MLLLVTVEVGAGDRTVKVGIDFKQSDSGHVTMSEFPSGGVVHWNAQGAKMKIARFGGSWRPTCGATIYNQEGSPAVEVLPPDPGHTISGQIEPKNQVVLILKGVVSSAEGVLEADSGRMLIPAGWIQSVYHPYNDEGESLVVVADLVKVIEVFLSPH